jgi:hypothetical protein
MKMAKLLSLRCAKAAIASAQGRPAVPSPAAYFINHGKSRLPIKSDATVIHFRPRAAVPRCELTIGSYGKKCASPVEDLRKYELCADSDHDYRHRMQVNLLAATVVIFLMVTGSWMVETIINSWPG